MSKKIIFLLFLIFISANLHAAPFRRMSNMVDIPEAYGLRHFEGNFGVSMSFYPLREQENSYEMDGKFCIGLLNWGLVGVSSFNENNFVGHVQLGLPLKNELNGYPHLPVISVGFENISSKEYLDLQGFQDLPKHHENNSFYIVASKDLSYIWRRFPVQLHLGIGNGRFIGTDKIGDTFRGVFMGLRYAPSKKFNLMIEEDGRDLNSGLNLNITERFTFSLAWMEIEEMFVEMEENEKYNSADWVKFGFSVQYRFGPFDETAEEKEILERIREEREKVEILENNLEEIRKKRENIEKEIEELKKKTESQEEKE